VGLGPLFRGGLSQDCGIQFSDPAWLDSMKWICAFSFDINDMERRPGTKKNEKRTSPAQS
jgi:hypothetical protein